MSEKCNIISGWHVRAREGGDEAFVPGTKDLDACESFGSHYTLYELTASIENTRCATFKMNITLNMESFNHWTLLGEPR